MGWLEGVEGRQRVIYPSVKYSILAHAGAGNYALVQIVEAHVMSEQIFP